MAEDSELRTDIRHPFSVFSPPEKAGDGNRTHMTSLEGWSFTTKLHPQSLFVIYYFLFIIYTTKRYNTKYNYKVKLPKCESW